MAGSRRMLSLWGPPVLVMAAIFAFSANPSSSGHHGLLILLGRKAGHVTGYALLMGAWWRALHATVDGRRAPWLAYGLTVAYAATDELHQTLVRNRVGTWHDVAIDAAGALVTVAIVLATRSRRRNPAAA